MRISLEAGATGLNLTAADHVFLMDPWWWNPFRGGAGRPTARTASAVMGEGGGASAAGLTRDDLLQPLPR